MNQPAMKFIKYCKQEHNPAKGCSTIQLGTLDYYRELDPKFYKIADELEPFYKIDRILDNESGKFYDNNEAIVPNCYIFCVSTEEAEPSSIDSVYDSKYYIDNPEAFCDAVAKLLAQQLTEADLTEAYPDLMQQYSSNQDVKLEVCGFGDFVKYESIDVINQSIGAFHHRNLAGHYLKIIYRKHDKFSSDAEYRFAFIIYHPLLKVLRVRKEPKILTINSDILNSLANS